MLTLSKGFLRMKIIDIIKGNKPSLSFEVFPPKTFDSLESVRRVTEEIADLHPGYMSVTYGAGGTTDVYTAEIASCIAKRGVTPLAHLSCIGSDEEKVDKILVELRKRGVENILALRGDLPVGVEKHEGVYRFASDLVAKIREVGGFSIGGACYPEGHPESVSAEQDLINLKNKVDRGLDFLTTQMFFDNSLYYRFLDRAAAVGIDLPVIPGIMPITAASQVDRVVALSGSYLPPKFIGMVEKYGSDAVSMKQAGIDYATEQARDLYDHGVKNLHVYSMNKPDVAGAILCNLSDVVVK